MTRQAISPRLAIRILPNMPRTLPQRLCCDATRKKSIRLGVCSVMHSLREQLKSLGKEQKACPGAADVDKPQPPRRALLERPVMGRRLRRRRAAAEEPHPV